MPADIGIFPCILSEGKIRSLSDACGEILRHSLKKMKHRRMAGNQGFGALCFRFVQVRSRPVTKYVYHSVSDVTPSQTNSFGSTKASADNQQYQHLVRGLSNASMKSK
jgi:hypothetical protein